jgi:hypothetical protein
LREIIHTRAYKSSASSLIARIPSPPYGIPYLFITLYQNQLNDSDCQDIIHDIHHHTYEVSLIHLHGFHNIDSLATLKRNVATSLQNLLLSLCACQTSTRLFVQVEKEAYLESTVCTFHTVDMDLVMASIPFLSQYISSCVLEDEWHRVFLTEDCSINALTKSSPVKKGTMQIASKSVPLETMKHTSCILRNMVKAPAKRVSPPAPSTASTSTITLDVASSSSRSWSTSHQQSTVEQRFQAIEQQLSILSSHMDSIESLCIQLKNNTDIIS